jgi:hypothetical protein
MLRPHLLRKLTNLFALGQEVFLTPDKRFASLESMVDATNYASARPVRNFAQYIDEKFGGRDRDRTGDPLLAKNRSPL